MTRSNLPMPNKVEVTITKILERGTCPLGHKTGDKFSWPEDTGKLCPTAFHALYTPVNVLRFGGSYPWEDDPDVAHVCCSDPSNPVVFEIRRL